MSYEKEFYLVRHGDYDLDSRNGSLNSKGREIHAPAARDELIARGLGSSAILLSSDAQRAIETAHIIGEGLGIDPILSNTINVAGNRAAGVRDLDKVVATALQEAGVEIDEALHDLIVVTHAPMLAIAKGIENSQVKHGEVFTYIRNSWNNPDAPK